MFSCTNHKIFIHHQIYTHTHTYSNKKPKNVHICCNDAVAASARRRNSNASATTSPSPRAEIHPASTSSRMGRIFEYGPVSHISRGIGWPLGKKGDNRLRLCVCMFVCVREKDCVYVTYSARYWVAVGKER